MSANKINVVKTEGVEWEYEISSTTDKPSATIVYTDDFQGWGSRAPLLNTPHPDLPQLLLEKIKAKRKDGDQIEVTLSYVALTEAGVPGKPAVSDSRTSKYYLQGSTGEEHILTNAYCSDIPENELKALFAISNGTEEDKNGNSYADTIATEKGLNVLAKIRRGTVACKAGSIVYGQRKIIKDLSELEFDYLAKIYDVPPGPVVDDGNQWLYVGGSASPVNTDQKAWEMDRQWLYSPDGWDDNLYRTPP